MSRKFVTTLLVVLLAVFLIPGPAAFAGEQEAKCRGPFEVRDGEIYDAQGRIVYFRGVNIGNNAKGTIGGDSPPPLYQDPVPPGVPFEPGEGIWWDYLNEWGFNLVRFCVFWEAIEPEKGVYDTEYLDKVEALLKEAADHDIYVIVDMHQDNFSRYFHGDGAPRWAVEETGVDPDNNDSFGGQFWGLMPLLTRDMRTSVTLFWNSMGRPDGLLEHHRDAFLEVVKRVKDNDHVIAYDLLNEPQNGNISNNEGLFENEYLKPYYEEVIAELRKIDPGAICLISPLSMDMHWSKMEPFEPEVDGLIWTSHIYDPVSNLFRFQVLPSRLVVRLFYLQGKRKAASMGMPYLVGEYGAPFSVKPPGTWKRIVDTACRVMERGFTSSIFWDYSVRDDQLWNNEDCSLIDIDGNIRYGGLDVVSRPYVRRLKGTPVKQTFDTDTNEYVLEFRGGSLLTPTVIHVPKSVQYPHGFRVRVSDGFCSYNSKTGELTYRCPPRLLRKHRLVITPAY